MSEHRLSRRRFIATTAATAGATYLAAPAIAKDIPVKYTLPWLAEGNSLFMIAGKQMGIFASHGIDIDISRGYGSVSACQAVATGKFDFGSVILTPAILLIGKGMPLVSLGILDYDAGMGVGVLDDSPIKTPQDLPGHKIGDVPTSAEFPFFAAFAQMAGFDAKAINFVNTDAKVLERVVAQRQVEGMTGIASSSLPIFISQKIPVRWMLYSSVGVPSYGGALITTPGLLERDPKLCEAMTVAACESMKWVLTHPQEAEDLFFKAYPEEGLNPNAKDFLRIGVGLHDMVVARPEAKEHGIGYGDPGTLNKMIDMTMKYVATPDMKRPAMEDWYHGEYAGKVTLSAAEWQAVDARTVKYSKLLS